VLDVLAIRALQNLGLGSKNPITKASINYWMDHYWDYVSMCRDLAVQSRSSLRELDRALWQWAKCGCP
jgi:hypothetical protein